MLTETRQEEIVRLVYERGSITVAELKKIFDISESTIRRDITVLDKEGRLTKVFGGAIALQTPHMLNKELSMVQKQELQRTEKQSIARYAATLIEPDDCVFLDAGTTTGWMIEYIREVNATYVTNSFSHAKRLADKGFRVLLIGGEAKSKTDAVVGAEAVLNLQKYHFSKGFFGANGVERISGFTTPDANEAMVKQTAVRNTQPEHRYFLTTASKFGEVYAVTFAGLENGTILTEENVIEAFPKSIHIVNVMDQEVNAE